MRKRLDLYKHNATRATLVPWALIEPESEPGVNPDKRRELFGDAGLVLLYSGNLGQAHQYSLFLKLARAIRNKNPQIIFAFSSSGNKFEEFKSKVTEQDSNIKFLPFAKIDQLQDRLSAADLHLISLRNEWSGIVVPSKFFGSLAMARPLLFHGPQDSAINDWIKNFNMGLNLTEANLDEIVDQLVRFAQSSDSLEQWRENAYQAYHHHFSKKIVLDKWDELLVQAKAQTSR